MFGPMRYFNTSEAPGSPDEPSELRVGTRRYRPEDIVQRLIPYVSDARRERIDRAIDQRTVTVTPVLDRLIDGRNVNAVMRSAEALGFQSIHILPGEGAIKPTAKAGEGSQKWLDLWKWDDPDACADYLQSNGYLLAALDARDGAPFETLDFTRKTALLFGNERDGVSDALLARADFRGRIGMCGFTTSYNVSVAAGIVLYGAYRQRTERLGGQGDLTETAKMRLKAVFYLRSVRHAAAILRRTSPA